MIRAVGVETGGSNVQFAVNPQTEEILVIEMNPRVSRCSALASKATGFPIAKIAARLAVGYRLDEIDNDITGVTPACFEPTIDYVVVKWPRFAFEKFPGTDPTLTTHMKSVGEAMAIGRTFPQAFAKALRSRELDKPPCLERCPRAGSCSTGCRSRARTATRRSSSCWVAAAAWRRSTSARRSTRGSCASCRRSGPIRRRRSRVSAGFARWTRARRSSRRARPTTTRAGSARRRGGPVTHEVVRGERASVVILGSGPNRIGQGIEFDYCCVHAAMTVRESGRDAVMINCNPETVSTDYDTSDRLYFEPLTLEDVLGVIEVEQPEGVVVQFGGQTPLRLAAGLAAAGVPLLGTSVEAIDLAEDRGRFGALLCELGYKAPPYATARSVSDALEQAGEVGYPLLVRPSYVLGGRAMEIVYSREGLADYLSREPPPERTATPVACPTPVPHLAWLSSLPPRPSSSTGSWRTPPRWTSTRCATARRFGSAGSCSTSRRPACTPGDSACVLPPHSLGEEMLEQIRSATRELALAIGVVGLLNVQYAVHAGELYVIEANPRASRTVPFVSKAVGVPLAKLACRIMLGERIADFGLPGERQGLGYGDHVSVKEAVLPFDRFEGSDAVLGPEMRSTGEVMGIARDFPSAFAKAQAAAGVPLPNEGTAFITVTDSDKSGAFAVAQILHDVGFRILATRGTAEAIARMGVPVQRLNKIGEGSPHVVDWIERGDVDLVVNTPTGSGARTDGWEIRRAARRARHSLPDDARRGRQRGAGDRAGPGRRRARGAVPAGAPRQASPRSERAGRGRGRGRVGAGRPGRASSRIAASATAEGERQRAAGRRLSRAAGLRPRRAAA